MTTRTSASTGWALVPVLLWMAQIVAGLVAGSALCTNLAAMHGVAAILVTVSGYAVYRVRSVTRAESQDAEGSLGLVGRVGFRVGLLFTAGIVLSWVMAGLGNCL